MMNIYLYRELTQELRQQNGHCRKTDAKPFTVVIHQVFTVVIHQVCVASSEESVLAKVQVSAK